MALNKVKMGKKVEKVVKEKTITPVEEEGPRNPEDYVCTGNLEQDFTELCNRMEILEYPVVIPRRTAVSLNGLLDEMQSLTASDKSTPSSAAGTKEHISFFRPTVQVEMDNDDTKLVKAIYIRAWVIDERYIFILQKCLPALTALQTVSLWNVGLTKDTFIALVAIFRQCANLRSVVLDGNPIDQQPYHLLMSEDSTIQNLTLRNNQIDDAGAKLIGEALSTTKKCNGTLTSLNLNFNHITDVGICSIADGLRLNRCLLWLSAAYNQISDVGAKKLAEVLIPFALTHEEIVERRLLQLNSQERQRMITIPRRPDSKSDRSSQLGSTTTLDKSDKSQRSTKGASKKKDKRDMTIPEKPVAAASQISPKRDDIRMLKRGSISKIEFSKTKGKVTKRNISADQELPGAHRPLLEAAEHRDGQVYLAGNTCLLSLNLSHNRITEMGLKALLEALKVQVSSNKPTIDGRATSGLLRLLVAKNEFPPMCDSYTSLQELILARDPIVKHRIICSPMPSHSGSQ